MTEPTPTDAQRPVPICTGQRIAFAKRAWVAITVIQSVMHNEKVKDGHILHWQALVTYLEHAANCARNLERTSRDKD